MTPDEEQACIRQCIDILERVTGRRPLGWISPVTAFTEHTRQFLAAEKLIWHGDARDADLPSVVETGAGPIVAIPSSDFTDNRVLRSSPQDLWDVYGETFDYLRAHEAPGLLALSMHCHFGGRPMITAVFEKILNYMRKHDDVWFATFGEVARWVLDAQRDADAHPRRLIKR
jgi:peptidoglycan/xylan/chitin deacetylase (PgdA/CDA1 family)